MLYVGKVHRYTYVVKYSIPEIQILDTRRLTRSPLNLYYSETDTYSDTADVDPPVTPPTSTSITVPFGSPYQRTTCPLFH